MSRIFLAIAVLVFATVCASAQKAEERAAIGVVENLFAEMANHNPAAIAALWTKDSNLTALVTGKDGKKRVVAFSGEVFSRNFAEKKNEIRELMYAPDAEVDGDLAVVYGRYVFFVDAKVSHCGLNSFNLVRSDGVWKIANAVSSIDPNGCTAKEKKMKAPK